MIQCKVQLTHISHCQSWQRGMLNKVTSAADRWSCTGVWTGQSTTGTDRWGCTGIWTGQSTTGTDRWGNDQHRQVKLHRCMNWAINDRHRQVKLHRCMNWAINDRHRQVRLHRYMNWAINDQQRLERTGECYALLTACVRKLHLSLTVHVHVSIAKPLVLNYQTPLHSTPLHSTPLHSTPVTAAAQNIWQTTTFAHCWCRSYAASIGKLVSKCNTSFCILYCTVSEHDQLKHQPTVHQADIMISKHYQNYSTEFHNYLILP